jgi:hypothetical protein
VELVNFFTICLKKMTFSGAPGGKKTVVMANHHKKSKIERNTCLRKHTVGEMTVFAPDKKRTFRPLAPDSKVI